MKKPTTRNRTYLRSFNRAFQKTRSSRLRPYQLAHLRKRRNQSNQIMYVTTPHSKESRMFDMWEKADERKYYGTPPMFSVINELRKLEEYRQAEYNAEFLKSFFCSEYLGIPFHAHSINFEAMKEEVQA